MADINLNIGSDDLDKLKKLLAEIQKAADKLAKTIERTGTVVDDDVTKAKRLAAEHKKIENAIKKEEIAAKRLNTQQERVNQRLNEQKGIIGGLEKEARDFRSAMKSAQNEAEMKKAQTGLRKVQTALQKVKGTTASWGKALGSFQFKFNALGNIAANVLSKITLEFQQAIKDSIKLASQAEGVEKAFNRLGRPGFLKELQQATRGTVDNLRLMQSAVQAKNFKIPLEQLATYFEFATSRAIQTGESVDFLVNSIITGIGRKSVLVMDNLGISAVELQEEVKKVGDFGLAAGNIIERAIADAGDVADTTATKIARLNTAYTNFKIIAGEKITQGFLARGASAAFERWTNILGDASTSAAVADFMEFFQTISDSSVADQIAAIEQKTKDLTTQIEFTAKQARELEKRAEGISFRPARKDAEEEVEALREINGQNVALLRVYQDQLSALKGLGEGEEKQRTGLNALEDQLKELKELRNNASLEEINALSESILLVEEKIKKYKEQFTEVERMVELFKELNDEELDEGDQEAPLQFFETATDSFGPTEEKFQTFLDGLIAGWNILMGEIEDENESTWDSVLRKISGSMQIAGAITSQFSNIFRAQKEKELSAVGDNAEKRLAIEKEFAKKEQDLAIISAVINTAQGIVKVLSDYGLPWGLIPAAAMAALGAAQISTIKSQQFAEGEVDIKGPSHASGGISAEIEGGESVINKKSTQKYKSLLDAINQDDQVRIAAAMSRDKKIMVKTDPYTQKMFELMSEQVQYGEDNDYYYKHKGNKLIKTPKK